MPNRAYPSPNGIKPASFHWDRFTSIYAAIEILIGLSITVLGVMFCYKQTGLAFHPQNQLYCGYGLLAYGLILFLSSVWCYAVMNTYRGFILLILAELVCGLVSLGFGPIVFLWYKKVLQHGYIQEYVWPISNAKLIIAGAAIVHGLWVLLHTLTTILKRGKVKPNYKKLKQELMTARAEQLAEQEALEEQSRIRREAEAERQRQLLNEQRRVQYQPQQQRRQRKRSRPRLQDFPSELRDDEEESNDSHVLAVEERAPVVAASGGQNGRRKKRKPRQERGGD